MIIVQVRDHLYMEDFGIQNYKEPFAKVYSFWGKLLVIGVFFDYIVYRSAIIITAPFFSLIISLIDYALYAVFFCLVFYKFYIYIFNYKIFFSINGIVFLILGTLKLYIQNIMFYHIVELLFFISLISLYLQLLLPLIISKETGERDRGCLVFIFIMLISSALNSLTISLASMGLFDMFENIILIFQTYITRLSSSSFLIFILYYTFLFLKNIIIDNVQKSFLPMIIIVSICTFFTVIFRNAFYILILSLYNALQVVIYMPFFIYIFIMMLFFIVFLSYLIAIISMKKTSVEFISFSLLILSGLDMSVLYLRLISLFAIMELFSFISYVKINDKYSDIS